MSRKRVSAHRLRGLTTLLKRGHCAPAVMETILRAEGRRDAGLVKTVGGLPGGIGNTGCECGGITAPLALYGLAAAAAGPDDGLPALVARSRAHLEIFSRRHRTPFCREIRGPKGRLLPCIMAVLDAPGITAATADSDGRKGGAIGLRESHRLLVTGMSARGFHCARAVLDRLPGIAASHPELRGATAAFIGGTACEGLTCGALTAGIMILGRRLAEIENSYLRVVRMIVLMKTGGDAFADRINRFNAVMNMGNRLAGWFSDRFGSTRCRDIAGADFSSPDAVRRYLDRGIPACRDLAAEVAAKVEEALRAAGAGRGAAAAAP